MFSILLYDYLLMVINLIGVKSYFLSKTYAFTSTLVPIGSMVPVFGVIL